MFILYICTFFIFNKISSYTTYYIDYVFHNTLFLEKIMHFLDQLVCRNLKITKRTRNRFRILNLLLKNKQVAMLYINIYYNLIL